MISQATLRAFSFGNWTMERRQRVFSFTYVFVGSESYIEHWQHAEGGWEAEHQGSFLLAAGLLLGIT